MTALRARLQAFARTDQSGLFWAGVFAWAVVLALTWPAALSFSDELGYLGQARLLLSGELRPGPDTIGVWVRTPGGLVPQYPPLVGIALTPFVAITPRAGFVLGGAAAIALAWVSSRVLRAWGKSPVWGLVVLAHPAVVILSRTVMADLILATAAVGAWWALKHDRRIATVALFVCLVSVKPPGVLLGAALLGGLVLQLAPQLVRRDLQAVVRAGWGLLAFVAGLAVALALNWLVSGKLWFGYNFGGARIEPFRLEHVLTTGPVHLLSLLVCPPLLLLGIWPYWSRRELGPLLAIFGYAAMMSLYYFVDAAPLWVESVVLSQRLILPVVAFLLIGYASLLASLAGRFRGLGRAAPALLILVPVIVGGAIGVRHRRVQEPMRRALSVATDVTRAAGVSQLATTYEAAKVALLYAGATRFFNPRQRDEVVLCSRRSASYRHPEWERSCVLDGYRTERTVDGLDVLVRVDRGSAR